MRNARKEPVQREEVREQVIEIEPQALRLPTTAKVLDCSESTVRKLIAQGKLKVVQIGADRRVTTKSIRALMS